MTNIIDVTLPSLGADMTEGTLVEWQVKPGDALDKGDIIALLETQKGLIDMEVFQKGVVIELLLEPVVTVPVGTVIARMRVGEELTPSASEPSDEVPPVTEIEASPVRQDQTNAAVLQQVIKPRQGVLASPVVRKLASEQQLDLSQVSGSGPKGAVLLRDLPVNEPKVKTSTSIDSAQAMRSAIAAAMAKSKREIPHYYLSLEVDITETQRWLTNFNADRGPEERVLLLALVLKAIAQSLQKYPDLNGTYQGQKFIPNTAVHIANVISLRAGGLVVPVMHHVDQLSVEEIMIKLSDLSERARRGILRSSDLIDASITVSSMGERGSDLLFGVIYPPQVAIIGVGKPRKTMLVIDGQPMVSDVVTVSLAADHRVSDGMIGAKFLNTLSNKLQNPEKL